MKKKIPLAILETLQPVADGNLELIKIMKDPNSMFHLIDKDENSDFYFKVTKQEARSGKLHYLTQYKPTSKNNVNAQENWQTLDGVLVLVKNWLELIQAYNKIQTVYDDPILKINQERFEKQFDILDEDADIASFDLQQQIFLDDYLDNVKAKLLTLQEGRSQGEVKELEELIKDASDIQSDLTKETKRKITKRLSRFWAKAQKVGIDVIKEIFVKVTAELTKKLITGG